MTTIRRALAVTCLLILWSISPTTARATFFLPDSHMSVTNESGDWGTQHADPGQFVASNVIDGNITEPPFGGENGSGFHEWLGREGALGENFTLDLKGEYTISEIDLYNTHNGVFNDRGTINFHILASSSVDGSGALTGGTLILTGTLSDTSGQATITPDLFFPTDPTAYRYLQFFSDTAKGNNGGLNEIAVRVPEPASCTLFALGLVGLMIGLRKRRG